MTETSVPQRIALDAAGLADLVDHGLRGHWAGRPVVVLTQFVDGGVARLAAELSQVDAEVAGVLSAVPPGPGAPDIAPVWFPDDGSDADTWLADPPARLSAWLDRIDPGRRAVIAGGNFTAVGSVCGRPVHGWRRPEWVRLEDKTAIDRLWQHVGVPAPAHVVLPVGDPAIAERVRELDRGAGVVLALDATTGNRGDAKGLRWVRSGEELAEALRWAQDKADRVRIAEFVPGVPCSVLAMVLQDGVAVFDPIEIVTLRDPRTADLVFCGSSTWWRPGAAARDEIREHVRRVGGHIGQELGYRGLFSVDGVLGADGFRATELNPRHASGLGLRQGWPDFPLYLVQRAIQESVPGIVGLPSADVESIFRRIVADHPSLSVTVPLPDAADGEGVWQSTVRYRVRGGRAQVLDAGPPREDGAVAPVVAAFATATGARGLVAFDTPVPVTDFRRFP
ncbi:hypothetical protein ACWEIJ_25420 [Lentzea sp. NPDC004789]